MAQIALEVQKIAQLALEAQNNAPHDPLHPAAATVPSSYTEVLDTVSWPNALHFPATDFDCNQVRLTETLLGIAESLRKPRGSLFASH